MQNRRMADFRFAMAKHLALTIGVLILSGAGITQVSRVVPDPGEGHPELRVMTYNIHHGAGNEQCPPRPAGRVSAADCGLNLARIADIIRDANAGIVGLQEVDRFWTRSGGVDQPRLLAEMLGMFVCFGPNLQLAADAGAKPREYGTAILSRFPLRSCQNTRLARVSESNEQRGLLSAEVVMPNGSLRVMVTHLSIEGADRVPQTEELARASAESALPTILMGDLNTKPEAESLRPLLAGMRDLWAVAGEGDGPTSPSHPKRQPKNRIDYIFVSPGMGINGIEVMVNEVTRMASDHYPVLARIRLANMQ